LNHVMMPEGKCKIGLMTKAKCLDALSAIKVPSAKDFDVS